MHVAELESNTNDLHEKFEIALANLEKESDEKDEEIAAANREVEQLGHRIYELEEEHDEQQWTTCFSYIAKAVLAPYNHFV